MSGRRPGFFIDRDGVLNEVTFRDGGMHSPRTWEELKTYPGLEALAEIKALGFALVMITNQPDIERKIVTEKFIAEVHEHYRKTFALDAVYVCPYSDNAHPMKKPNPGMFLKAAEDLKLNLAKSFHLGDTDRDIEGARRAGVRSILWSRDYNRELRPDYRITSLSEVLALLK